MSLISHWRHRWLLQFAAAFVPVNAIDDALDVLNDQQHGVEPELQSVVDWLEDNYVSRLNRNGTRCRAIFPVNMWNTYDRTLNRLDRTNNHAKAAHRRLQSILQMNNADTMSYLQDHVLPKATVNNWLKWNEKWTGQQQWNNNAESTNHLLKLQVPIITYTSPKWWTNSHCIRASSTLVASYRRVIK